MRPEAFHFFQTTAFFEKSQVWQFSLTLLSYVADSVKLCYRSTPDVIVVLLSNSVLWHKGRGCWEWGCIRVANINVKGRFWMRFTYLKPDLNVPNCV